MRPALPLLVLCAFGCSAIINPDPDRLGDEPDSGTVMLMDGGGADAGDRDSGDPIDSGRECPPSCDDGVPCTDDGCEAGRCVNRPNDGACPGGERCNPVMGCVAERCSGDGECDDGVFCNGAERCEAGAPGSGCVPGDPVVCVDDFACTADICDEDVESCAHVPDASACNVDFCVVGRTCSLTVGCNGGVARSCDDASPCTVDSCNEGEDRCDAIPLDADGDGFPAAWVASPGGVVVMCPGSDCDDDNPAVNPSATEVCNGVDDNCDGTTDEGCPTTPDTCASAAPIVLGGTGTGSVTGRFSDFAHDYQTASICGAQPSGRDAVYYVDLPPGIYDLTIDTIGSAADTVLAVGLVCSMDGFQAVCDDDYDRRVGTDSRIWLHRVGSPAGPTRIYILVDGYRSTTSGDFVVNVTGRPAATDGCLSLGATPAMDISGGGSVLGFSRELIGLQRGSCQPFGDTDPEAIFRFTGPGTGAVDFDVFSTTFVPDIYIRSRTCTGFEIACDLGAPLGGGVNGAFLRHGVTVGRQYYLFVDGGRGPYAVYFDPN